MTIKAVIFDLDGVVRHFAPCDTIETQHALAPGIVTATAFESDLLEPTITGRWSHEEWVVAIGDRLAQRHGEGARAAARAFVSLPTRVDDAVLALVDRLRANHTVALLTNGTTRVEDELRTARIDEHFDHVFNSARIGYAKPDVRVFEHAMSVIGCAPQACVFIDDSESKLAGAHQLGIRTVHFTGLEPLVTQLRAWDVRC